MKKFSLWLTNALRAAALLAVLALWLSGCQGTEAFEAVDKPLAAAPQALGEETCLVLKRGPEEAVADAQLSSHQPHGNAGRQPEAQVGQVGRHTRYTLLRFDTSLIPPHATLTSATLSLWHQGSSRAASLQAHAITAPWEEQAVTWRSFGGAFAPQLAATAQVSGRPGLLSLPLRELAATWVRHPALNNGLLLEMTEGHALLASSESPHPERRPSLSLCYFLPDSSPATSTSASLLLRVLDGAGLPVSAASVTQGDSVQATDGAGYVVLSNLPPGRVTARIEAVGSAPAVVSLELTPGAHASQELRLHSLGEPLAFSAEEGATLERGALRVTLPPRALVTEEGVPVSGTVEATLIPLDPSATPASALPGPLEGLSTPDATQLVPLESFFMAEVSLSQDGQPLQLAPGATATLELLLPESRASRLSPGDTIPAWWLDTEKGYWVREGTGTIQPSSTHPGRLAWVVQVSHFTWWNCDAPLTERSCVDVQVLSNTGLPIPVAQVGAAGVNYTGLSRTVFTGLDGHACVEIMRGGSARVYAGLPDWPTAEAIVTGSEVATTCGGTGCTALTLTLTPPVCTPGDMQTCAYSGPAGTQDVGLCRASHRYCNASGLAWGTCEGEVLPATETCLNTFDEDCDGVANEGCGCNMPCYSGPPNTAGVGLCRAGTTLCRMARPPLCRGQRLPAPETCSTAEDDDCDGALTCTDMRIQAWRLGGEGGQDSAHLAVPTPDGHILLAGSFSGTLDLGNGFVLTAGTALFVAKLDVNTGQALWARQFDYTQSATIARVRFDGSGDIIASASFDGTINLGGTTHRSSHGFTDFLMKLHGGSGAFLWGTAVVGSSFSDYDWFWLDPGGNPVIAGTIFNTLTIGSTTLSRHRDGARAFAAKLDGGSGAPIWVSALNSPAEVTLSRFAPDRAGNPVVAGLFYQQLSVGNVTLSNTPGRGGFVMKLDGGSGAALWASHLASSSCFISSVALDGSDDVVVTGGFNGSLTAGGRTLTSLGEFDAFVLKLGADSGAPVWATHVTSTSYVYLDRLTRDSSGNLFAAGRYAGRLTVGSSSRSSLSESTFLLKLDGGTGGPHWLEQLTGSAYVAVTGLLVDGSGNLLVQGEFHSGFFAFGSISLQNPRLFAYDSFLLKVGTAGEPLWGTHFKSSRALAGLTRVMVDASGQLLVGGSFIGDLTLGSTTLHSSPFEGYDGFISRLDEGSGQPLWLSHLDSSPHMYINPFELDALGNVLVTGSFLGTLSLSGQPPLVSAGDSDGFFLRISTTP